MSGIVIVDSSVWVDYLRGTETLQTIWLDQNAGKRRVGLPDLVLTEVLQGVCAASMFSEVLKELTRYRVFATGGEVLASASARNYCHLRSRGVTIRKTIDCLIATFCMTEGYSLLHDDRDFDPFEDLLGLHVVHPKRN